MSRIEIFDIVAYGGMAIVLWVLGAMVTRWQWRVNVSYQRLHDRDLDLSRTRPTRAFVAGLIFLFAWPLALLVIGVIKVGEVY